MRIKFDKFIKVYIVHCTSVNCFEAFQLVEVCHMVHIISVNFNGVEYLYL